MIPLNWLAILAAAVLHVLVGMFWYSPQLGFGKQWMKLVRLTKKDVKEGQKHMGASCLSP